MICSFISICFGGVGVCCAVFVKVAWTREEIRSIVIVLASIQSTI